MSLKKKNDKKTEGRAKALAAAMADINKSYGEGAIQKMTPDNIKEIPVISSGSAQLDRALGVGGFPTGRIIEVFGPESSGKTTLALTHAAEVQKVGGQVAIVDAEHALDPTWAAKIGLNMDEVLLSQPDTGEQGLEIVEKLVSSGAVDLIIVDSVAALTPRVEIEGDMGQSHVGLQARLMSQALRKITGLANSTGTTLIFINQLREKIGVMFGSPETTTGGKALKFYASVRLDIRRIETIKSGTEPVANKVRIKVIKNKVAPPFKQAETQITYASGFSMPTEVIDIGIELGYIRRAGSWFALKGEGLNLPAGIAPDQQLGQGAENAKAFLLDNPELYEVLYNKMREELFAHIKPADEEDEIEPDDLDSDE